MNVIAHLWALVLAAGDGNRVRSLTRTPEGLPAPKQFCTLDRELSLLRQTLNRATALVPTERIVTVVAAQHRRWWSRELSDCPTENVIVQPRNRGTAAGILLPLLRIVERDPMARIMVLPSDHLVANEEPLRQAILEAVDSIHMNGNRVVLLGMVPQESDAEYGWIVPSVGGQRVRPVASFVEKPNSTMAHSLFHRGALLNSLILLATGRALLQLYDHAAPHLVGEFISCREEDGGWAKIDALYQTLSSCDFSKEVLERSSDLLSVMRVSDCGWMDVGTPARLELAQGRQSSAGVSSRETVGCV